MDDKIRKKESSSLGAMLGFFFNIIGLLAGFLYPADSEERYRFISGWKSGFISFLLLVPIAIIVVFLIIDA